MTIEFGLLLPHFGEHGNPENIIEGSKLAEHHGFDSVWVRDHMMFEPHGQFEKPDNTFYEAVMVLTAVGAATQRIKLGTGALIPFRHPIHLALTTAGMANMFPGRLILGMGAGNSDRQFEQVGLGGIHRPELVESNANILRRLWTDDNVSYADDHYEFSDFTLNPKPPAGAIPPFWYCGNTPKSARLAVRYCDGWLPGRIGLATLAQRVETLTQLSGEAGRERPTVGVIPPTSVDHDRDEALSYINVEGLLAWANNAKFWVKPPSGRFERAEDLTGVMLAGTPDEVAAGCLELRRTGVQHLVFDLRFKYQRWFDQIEMLGTEVVPKVREELGVRA